MMRRRWMLTGAVMVCSWCMVGCAGQAGWKAAYELERAYRQEQEGRIRRLEAQRQVPQPQVPPAPQSPPVKTRGHTLPELVEICRGLYQAGTGRMGCQTDYDQEKRSLYMVVAFQNKAAKDSAIEAVSQNLSTDFCRIVTDVGVGGLL